MNNFEASILIHTIKLAKARKAHDLAKSDPSKNVSTGAALNEAEQTFQRVTRGFLDSAPHELDIIVDLATSGLARQAQSAVAALNKKPA